MILFHIGPPPYLPCVCPNDCAKSIRCIQISIKQIQEAFQSKNATIQIEQIYLELLSNETLIPNDILAKHGAQEIELCGSNFQPGNISFGIHPEAFRHSRNTVNNFIFTAFEMRNFNWAFLAEFNHLEMIKIDDSFNVQLKKLPQLPRLVELHIRRSTGLNN